MIPMQRTIKFQLTLLIAACSCLTAFEQPAFAKQAPTDLSGFSDEEIFAIADGQPLTSSDSNLARLLFRAQKTSEKTLHRFCRSNQEVSATEITQDPRSYRCHVVQLDGNAKLIRQCHVIDPAANLKTEFTLIHMATDQQDCLIAVADRGRPKRWLLDKPLNEPIQARAFFLTNFDFHPDHSAGQDVIKMPNLESHTIPLFVAKSIQWFPRTANKNFQVSESELLLAKHNVDIARLDRVRENVIGRISAASAPSFYQMLNAADRIPTNQYPESTTNFIQCLQDPAGNQGAAVNLTGQVRRVTEVNIDDDDFKSLGLSRYYQLDVFVPLGDNKIVFRAPKSKSDADPMVHENRFPVTVCVAQIPSEDIVRQNVTINTFFFQRWNFESQRSESDQSFRQDAPLFIGLKPIALSNTATPLNFWIGVAALSGISGIGLIYWFFGGHNRDAYQLRRQRELPEQIEIPKLDG